MDAALDFIVEEGIDKVNRLNLLLFQDGRTEDFMRSAKDREYQKQLFIEYGLEDAK